MIDYLLADICIQNICVNCNFGEMEISETIDPIVKQITFRLFKRWLQFITSKMTAAAKQIA